MVIQPTDWQLVTDSFIYWLYCPPHFLAQTMKKLTVQQDRVEVLLSELEPNIHFASQSSSIASFVPPPKPVYQKLQPQTDGDNLEQQTEVNLHFLT